MAEKDSQAAAPIEDIDRGARTRSSTSPPKLPVLLLRDIVVFPYMIVPLFVGREKSKTAIDQALSLPPDDPPPDPEGHGDRGPQEGRRLRHGHGRPDHADAQAPRRPDPDPGPGVDPGPGRDLRGGERPLHRPGRGHCRAGDRREDPRERGPRPQRPVRAGEGRLAGQNHPARGPDHRHERRRAGAAGRPDRGQPRAQGRRSPGDPRHHRPRRPAEEGPRAPGQGARAPRRPVADLAPRPRARWTSSSASISSASR